MISDFDGKAYTKRLRAFIDASQAYHGKARSKASTRELARISADSTLQQRIYYWKTNELTKPIDNYVSLSLIDPEKRTPYELKSYLETGKTTDTFSCIQLMDIIEAQQSKILALTAT